jgi:predicted nucleic-acid-binding protein
MIGLDTNVLVRYIVCDDDEQAAAATRLIDSQCTEDTPGFVNLVVLCEVSWVLARGYKYDRATVAQVIRGILSSSELIVDQSDTAWRALGSFEAGKADFADYIIGGHNRSMQAQPTYTFDQCAAGNSDFMLVDV